MRRASETSGARFDFVVSRRNWVLLSSHAYVSSSRLVFAPSLFMRILALLAVLLAQPGLSALAVNLTVCVEGDCDCAHDLELAGFPNGKEVGDEHASSEGHSEGCEDTKQCCGCHPHWLATPPRVLADEAFALSETPSFAALRAPHPRGARARAVTDDHPREMMRPPNA